jgi:hypothetical protein
MSWKLSEQDQYDKNYHNKLQCLICSQSTPLLSMKPFMLKITLSCRCDFEEKATGPLLLLSIIFHQATSSPTDKTGAVWQFPQHRYCQKYQEQLILNWIHSKEIINISIGSVIFTMWKSQLKRGSGSWANWEYPVGRSSGLIFAVAQKTPSGLNIRSGPENPFGTGEGVLNFEFWTMALITQWPVTYL